MVIKTSGDIKLEKWATRQNVLLQMRSHLNLFAVERPTLSMPPLLSCWPSIKSTFLWIVRNFKVFSSFVFAFCRLLICSLLRWSRRIWFIFSTNCLLDWLLERIRDRVPRAISPNKPPIKRFSQSIPSIASVTEIDTINSDQSSTKCGSENIGFWQIDALCACVFLH